MAGIYIHIPFCRKACTYCNFFFSVSQSKKSNLIKALLKEIELRKDYLGGEYITSIYFGGGTPSLIETSAIRQIMDVIEDNFTVVKDAEVTLEANPDDLTGGKLHDLAEAFVNRLSIGIQSFSDADLKFMNRSHTAANAVRAVKAAQDTGFSNLSVDLIYGTPGMTTEQWKKNLEIAFTMDVPHLSCYCLTIEEKTKLFQLIRDKKVPDVDEQKATEQLSLLLDMAQKNGFEQYEISNFCRDEMYAKHNTSYWKREKYLGIGPSAHSFNGDSRQWNVSNISGYIDFIGKEIIPFEKETLTASQKFNEYVMTSLRTQWGCDVKTIHNLFGEKFEHHFIEKSKKYLQEKMLEEKENIYLLTREGKFFADRIAAEIFSD
ncbi:MAG: radical SAM family heme chaperone HemW [Bacteroidia bacterium]|nr:radical SAM family heme chaperone HemW [Bacteroidia bacterium]